MLSSGVANLSGNIEEARPTFQVIPSKGAAYNSSNSSILYIANFDMVGAPGSAPGENNNWSKSITVAAECALWFCL